MNKNQIEKWFQSILKQIKQSIAPQKTTTHTSGDNSALHHCYSDESMIVVALSGGADSVFLLHLLRQLFLLSGKNPGKILIAAHAQHNLRSNDSQDQNFCSSLCNDWQIPLHTTQLHVPENKNPAESDEMAARRLRYDFLKKIKKQYQAQCLALGHHLNDQIETILMRLGQGTGPNGLIAMREWDQGLWRPLLYIPKQNIVQYLNFTDIPYIEDPSNQDRQYLRNKIRPIAEDLLHVMPQIGSNLAWLQEILIQQKEIHNEWLQKWLSQCRVDWLKCPDCIIVPALCLADQSVARQKELWFFLMSKISYPFPTQKNMRHLWQQWTIQLRRIQNFLPAKNSIPKNFSWDKWDKYHLTRNHILWQDKNAVIHLIQMTSRENPDKSWFIILRNKNKQHHQTDLFLTQNIIESSKSHSNIKDTCSWKKIFAKKNNHLTMTFTLDIKKNAFLQTRLRQIYQTREITLVLKQFPEDFHFSDMRVENYGQDHGKWQNFSFFIHDKDNQEQAVSVKSIVRNNVPAHLRPYTPLLIYQNHLLALLYQPVFFAGKPRFSAHTRSLGFLFQ